MRIASKRAILEKAIESRLGKVCFRSLARCGGLWCSRGAPNDLCTEHSDYRCAELCLRSLD